MHKIYRVIKRTPLSTGHVQGQIVQGSLFKNQQNVNALIHKNVIAKISGPPLSELPGWKLRSEKLGNINIITVNDFLGVDSKQLAEGTGYKLRTIEKWKKEIVEKWLLAVPVTKVSK